MRSSAVVQLATRPLGGAGRLEDTVATFGFACAAAHWTLLPRDVLVGIFGGLHGCARLSRAERLPPTPASDGNVTER